MTLNRGTRVALVGVAIALIMDLTDVDSTSARVVFLTMMLLAIGAAARGPGHGAKRDAGTAAPPRPHER